ncbi:MAG: GNAT family N-acetyltransferase [Acidobacteriota bacterium]
MNLIDQLNETQVRQLHALYQTAWWAKERTLAQTRQCVQGSQIVIGLTDDEGNLIAFTRVVTDYTFKAFVFDVLVHEAYQGQGLGDRLVKLVKGHERLQGVTHIELYCRPNLCSFYGQHGFTQDVGDITLMRLNLQDR